jgi:PAS domain S-box-containing protein
MIGELRILLVEDRSTDADLIERALRRGGLQFSSRRVDQEAGFLQALSEFRPSLVLSDLSLPAFSGEEALALLKAKMPHVPLIFVSGTVGDEKAVDLLKLGATDYVIKDNLVRLVSSVQRCLEAVRLAEEHASSEEKYREIFDRAVVGIFRASLDGRYLTVNPAFARMHGYDSPEALLTEITDIPQQVFVHPERFEEQNQILTSAGVLQDFQVQHYRKDGTKLWLSLDVRVVHDQHGASWYHEGFAQDISERKEAEAKLEAAQARLLEASRHSGMAEVATNVLHNVGNVLNSVNVSTSLLSEKLRHSALPNLARVAALWRAHQDDLGAFVRDDPRARQLVSFLDELVYTLEDERQTVANEVRAVAENIEHINTIVSMQQHYTTVLGVIEEVRPLDLVEDALRMNAAALLRHGVQTVRDYQEVPLLQTERHKVLQILVNLISNAKYAMDEVDWPRMLRLQISASEEHVLIAIVDNGVGIPRENQVRIFEHGFSTRKGGHGFGLHSSALAARELGGSLHVSSEGTKTGAVFTLRLPLVNNLAQLDDVL